MHCNLRLVDSIEEIGRSDANIDWSSDDEEDWLTDIKAAFELLRTLFFLELFLKLYSKCFELHNYGSMLSLGVVGSGFR